MYARILVALDGSDVSLAGGEYALSLARRLGSEIIAAHVYDAGLHSVRFREMEPVLPVEYQQESTLTDLRDSHNDLIHDGFVSLSRGYMERYVEKARSKGLPVREIHREGRNYIELLSLAREERADLIVMGAWGLGAVDHRLLGSTALRVLRNADCDVLIARPGGIGNQITVGVDGSDEALEALRKAVMWARAFQIKTSITAAYDPHFHTGIFKTMASSLSQERQDDIGLAKQEDLHDRIIDDGLGKLYMTFLETAEKRCATYGIQADTHLLKGKAYHALADYIGEHGIGLAVIGRHGHHRAPDAMIGSNAEALAHIAPCSVLITRPLPETSGSNATLDRSITWDSDAEARLERIPAFARPMARSAIEQSVTAEGRFTVTLEDFLDMARRAGMGGTEEPSNE